MPLEQVGKIIDGQHRIAGLQDLERGTNFEMCVAIFVGADIATQANIFATVNLAQTEVNRSLAYDLFDYEKRRSPQKTAHHIAVALDQIENSPFHHRIKRLGTVTEGRVGETLTQAVVVEMLLQLITDNEMVDRDSLFRWGNPSQPSYQQMRNRPFRSLFLNQQDEDIARILLRYFEAARERWPKAWNDTGKKGNSLPRTNGFRALMRFLKPAYLHIVGEAIGTVPESDDFKRILSEAKLEDSDFNAETFTPGTSGESKFFKMLRDALT